MTESSTTMRASYEGDGSTASFPVPFAFTENADVVVTLRNDATGAVTPWVRGSHYSLHSSIPPTGPLTVLDPDNNTPQAGETLVIRRVPALTQELSLPSGGELPSSSIERQFDRLVWQAQRLNDDARRALRFPPEDSTALSAVLPTSGERASKFLAFDANGEPIAAAGTSADLTPVSGFMDTLLDDGDAETARGTLGAAAAAQTISAAGLATGGGDLSEDRTITVPVASEAEAQAGTDNAAAMTPLRTAQAIAALAVPPGTILDYAADTVPSGWLACDGSNVPRTTYAALFAAIGTTWGAGDGSTTFGLPDLRRRVTVGKGGSGTATLGNAVGNTGGEEAHSQTANEMPTHAHSESGASNAYDVGQIGAGSTVATASSGNTGNAGGGQAFNIVQPSAVVTKMIRT